MKAEKYKFGFDVAGLILFLLVMAPTFIWMAIPAPNDILKAESTTPMVYAIGSVCQILCIASLCMIINKERGKLRFSPLVIATIACVVMYFFGWVLYYSGFTSAWIILLLTIPPCAAFILFALDRKNLPAVVFAIGFTICHLIYGIVNFIK